MIDKIRWRETAERAIIKSVKKENNILAEKLTHEHTQNQELEKKLTDNHSGLRQALYSEQEANLELKTENGKYKKVVEAARDIKSVREEYRGNIDAEAFYYFGNAVVELIDGKLNQALKELK